MKLSRLLSYQLYKCSDYHETVLLHLLTPQTKNPIGETSPFARNSCRLSDRTLYPLRQTGMQMRPRPRPRPQILPFHQSLQGENRNGLCSSGVSRPSERISRKFPFDQGHIERNLSNQSRITSASRKIVIQPEDQWGVAVCVNQSRRSYACRHSCGQHASRLFACGYFC